MMVLSSVPRWVFLLGVTVLAAGCATAGPGVQSFFVQTPESAQHRALQTRMFETSNEKELLSASAAVLQDLGFQVEESIPDAGVLRAAKERSAREYGQEIARILVFILGACGEKVVLMPVDLHQQINATLVTGRSQTDKSFYTVRVSFWRTVWQGDGNDGNQQIPPGQYRLEMIYDQRIYQEFFAKLAKSVFLEANKI